MAQSEGFFLKDVKVVLSTAEEIKYEKRAYIYLHHRPFTAYFFVQFGKLAVTIIFRAFK